jgi:hypothetical protein
MESATSYKGSGSSELDNAITPKPPTPPSY